MDGDLVLRVVSDVPISDEELAEATRDLKDDLNELPGVEAKDLVTAAEPGTRDPFTVVLGMLVLSLFSYPTAKRAKKDLQHLGEIIRRYQERHKGKRVQIDFPDGTRIDAKNISEKNLTELLKSMPHQHPDSIDDEVSVD